MSDEDWLQIEQAANGCYSGKLEEWPLLKSALMKCNAIHRIGSGAASVVSLCQALWWSHKSEQQATRIAELEGLLREAESVAFECEVAIAMLVNDSGKAPRPRVDSAYSKLSVFQQDVAAALTPEEPK